MSQVTDKFDFIVVGGGTSGCLLAAKLSSTQSRSSVLLIEAGGEPVGDTLRSPYDRYTPAFTRPDLDHGYSTTAQSQLNDRILPYARGKGLGGSSALNFMVYLYGPAADYDRWAELVGDDNWQWPSTRLKFNEIENFHVDHVNSYSKYASPNDKSHGTSGAVAVSLPRKLEKGIDLLMDAAAEYGHPRNLDMNSGDPIGAGIFPSSYGNGYRTTSATAHLPNRPHNLTIWTNSSVGRVLFKGKKAIGIECVDGVRRKSPLFRAPNGRQTDRLLIAALCSKEVILCAGAFDSPKILLLSGIGPGAELASHDIDIVHDLPGVGKNLQDHPCVFLTTEVDPILSEIHAFESDTEGLLRARQEWLATGTGPLTHHNGTIFGAFLKLPHLQNSAEFKALDPSTRAQLLSPTVPHYEIANGSVLVPPGFPVANDSGYMTPIAILMNPQSRGHVTLRSADPADAALIDLKLLDHPYDRKVMVDLIRETVLFQQQSAVGKYFRRHILGPKSLSNEDIVEFINKTAAPLWHASGTVKMGTPADSAACVDSSFRVNGTDGLRVADLSVAPLTVSNHPQSTAYLIGLKAAEALIKRWEL